jgi:cell division inhibitor SepF
MDKLLGMFSDSIDDDGDSANQEEQYEETTTTYEDQEESVANTSRFSKKFANSKKSSAEEDRYDDQSSKQSILGSRRSSSKVVRLSSHKDTEVVVIKPTSLDDSQEITSELKLGNPVVLNFEDIEIELAQRIIDFVSGACFAINGNLRAVNKVIFIVAPANVDIVGDITTELINSGIIVPNIHG